MKLVDSAFMLVLLASFLEAEPSLISRAATPPHSCPVDLSTLRPEMEAALASVSSPSFKKTMLASLSASIPDAIEQADGINAQIAFLENEIAEQERVKRYSEKVARDANGHFMEPLKPCKRDEKGSYCTAVEQYYISAAANLANRAFLDALLCYKRQGMH